MGNVSTNTMILIAVLIFGGIFVSYLIFYRSEKKQLSQGTSSAPESQSRQLRLQAYERLVILAERISLPRLLERLLPGPANVRQFQQLLGDTIRQEYDYNLSQQIYVSPQSWQALHNLKEQNIFIINQIAATLPPDAPGIELSKKILEFLEIDPKASLHPIVLDALRYEAKQLMG